MQGKTRCKTRCEARCETRYVTKCAMRSAMRNAMRKMGMCSMLAAALLLTACGQQNAVQTGNVSVSQEPGITENLNETDENSTGSSEAVDNSTGITGAYENSDDSTGTDETGTEEKEYIMTSDNVKLLGRTHLYKDILWCSLSATGVEFSFTGTKCSVTFVSDSMSKSKGHEARIAIFVNGTRVEDELITEDEKTITFIEEAKVDTYTVRVVKLSESADSNIGIKSITTEGGSISPTKENDLKIEFIGDSITCGYGVDDELGAAYSTQNEDATKAYAYLTAQTLHADYSLVSYSGYGIISGYTTGDKQVNQLVPNYYEKLGHSYGTIGFSIDISNVDWDFTKYQPDIVVINLGTNDNSYCKGDEAKCAEFVEGYVRFLTQVRTCNPNAYIVASVGIMGQEMYASIETAVESYKEATGDERVTAFEFDVQSSADGYAIDWHPSAATHSKAAQKLVEALQEIISSEPAMEDKKTIDDKAATEDKTVTDDAAVMENEAQKRIIDKDKPVIALTFDDGPNTTTTVEVLDKLEQYGVVASFFVVGKNINESTINVMQRAVKMGCEIDNHSETHGYMNTMTEDEILSEVTSTSEKVFEAVGVSTKFFRPPFIAVSTTMLDVIDMPFICGYAANDWDNNVTAKERAERILEQSKDGAILLLHDMQGNSKTVEALDTIIPKLLEDGYQFVTVSELFETKEIELNKDLNIIFSFAEQVTMY